MKALSPEYRYHLKIALVPLVVLLFLWRADIIISGGIFAVILGVIFVVGFVIHGVRRDKRAAAFEKIACRQDGELSLSSLTSDLEELEAQASEMFGGNRSLHFLVAINVLDSVDQLTAFLTSLQQTEDEEILDSITPSRETLYLFEVAQLTTSVRHKILYEYRRKNGSLAYRRGDSKPLVTRLELMRRLALDERDEFRSFCQSIDNGATGGPSYFEERDGFLSATPTEGEREEERSA